MKRFFKRSSGDTTLSKPIHPLLKKIGIFLLIVAGLVMLGVVLWGLNEFFDRFRLRFQKPVILQSPIMFETRSMQIMYKEIATKSANVTPTHTPEEQLRIDELKQGLLEAEGNGL